MSPRISIRLLPRQSDRRLLELAGHGDERAFETLVRRYRPALLRFCRRLGLGEPAAEDAVQQSFTKAWLALDGAEEVRDLRPWLYRIAHNTALNALRGARETSAPLSDARAPGGPVVASCSIESSIQAREALSHVAALPQMQRDAVVLTAIQGRSHEEAAGVLGISDGAVRGLLYRARATLRSAAAAIAPQWLLERLPGAWSGVPTGADVSLAGATLGLGAAATKLGALAAGAGLLAAGVAGVAGVTGHAHGVRRAPDRGAPVQARDRARAAPGTLVASAGAPGTREATRPSGGGRGSQQRRQGRRPGSGSGRRSLATGERRSSVDGSKRFAVAVRPGALSKRRANDREGASSDDRQRQGTPLEDLTASSEGSGSGHGGDVGGGGGGSDDTPQGSGQGGSSPALGSNEGGEQSPATLSDGSGGSGSLDGSDGGRQGISAGDGQNGREPG